MDEVTIRPAVSGDVAAVLALWIDAGSHPSKTDDAESVTRLIDDHPGALLVAEQHGLIVGSILAGWDGWRGSIYRLAIAPDARRRGIARRLVEEAERSLADQGAVRSQATVVDADEHAIGFWEVIGWERRVGQARYTKG